MNDIERQLLENQKIIISTLTTLHGRKDVIDLIPSLDKCYWETVELLEPTNTNENCCDMEECVKEEKSE